MLEFSKELFELDSDNIFEVIKEFPEQVKKALEIGNEAPLINNADEIKEILILGMGGSAIGGDLIRAYLKNIEGARHLRISVNRNYDIPDYIDNSCLVIGSSYSGNTEETLTAFEAASEKTIKLYAICTDGKLEELAKDFSSPIAYLPKGFQPRCALGFSFFVLLRVLQRSGVILGGGVDQINKEIDDTLRVLEERTIEYREIFDKNDALRLANKFYNKVPVFYSACERLDSVNLRWRGQIQENAKALAFGNVLPEMNHNEINSWELPKQLQKDFVVVFMRDKEDHARIKLRFEAFGDMLKESGKEIVNLTGVGESLLARMFDLIYLADWVSFYLALMYGKDPAAIPAITNLKEYLSDK
jgi:glucose/mannose-6-phosphate isomerase